MSRLQRLSWSALLIGIVSSLSGCSLLGHADASAVTYVLRAAPQSKEKSVADVGKESAKESALKVLAGVAAPGYDTDRVLLTRADRSLDFFAASRWAASIPRLVDALALEVWRARGTFRTFDAAASAPVQYTLRLGVQRFEIEGEIGAGTRAARVRLRATVLRASDRALVGEFEAEALAPVTADRMSVIVAAFEEAANRALAELRDQAAAKIS